MIKPDLLNKYDPNNKYERKRGDKKYNDEILNLVLNNKIDITRSRYRSNAWFMEQTKILARMRWITPRRLLMKGGESAPTPKPKLGFMNLFFYDAKHKEILPYWDRFPLCMPISLTKDGFIGLNFHYLPTRVRALVLSHLVKYANNTNYDETTKIKISWQLIKSVTKLKIAKCCVKQYLWKHVASPFRQVPIDDYGFIALLPCQQFVGASASKVWADSMRGA